MRNNTGSAYSQNEHVAPHTRAIRDKMLRNQRIDTLIVLAIVVAAVVALIYTG